MIFGLAVKSPSFLSYSEPVYLNGRLLAFHRDLTEIASNDLEAARVLKGG
jgi:hypothetical protein